MRTRFFPLALVVLFGASVVASSGVSAAGSDATDLDDPFASASALAVPAGKTAPASAAKSARGGVATASSKPSKRRSRRSKKRVKVQGRAVFEGQLRALALPPPSGNLHLVNIAEYESLKINIYNEDGSYNNDAILQVSHLMRCKRTDTERGMEPRLLTVLSHVYDKWKRPLELVSGYRNQRRTTSHHFNGSASDIRISGVTPVKIKRFVESIDAGGMGVGYYPKVGFVHIDIRPPPSFRWTDRSRSNPDSDDKRPPRGVSRKKLRS